MNIKHARYKCECTESDSVPFRSESHTIKATNAELRES